MPERKEVNIMNVNILGTEYEIIKQSSKENDMLNNCSGYCDWTTRKLYICDYSVDKDDFEYENCKIHMNQTIRHEIMHAFLHESGLWSNSCEVTGNWAMNEEMVDWIAIQFPKILKAFESVGAL